MSGVCGRGRCALHGTGPYERARWLRAGARAARGAGIEGLHAAGVALSWRLTGLEASAGAGSLVGSAGEESVFSTTGTSATGAAAVSVSAELMAMASGVGSGAVR